MSYFAEDKNKNELAEFKGMSDYAQLMGLAKGNMQVRNWETATIILQAMASILLKLADAVMHKMYGKPIGFFRGDL